MKSIFKNTTAYLLLLLFLCNAIRIDFFEQLEKLPRLIEHYKHHVEEEGEQLSVYDFLVLHYDENSGHKQQENHEDLPLFTYCLNHTIQITVDENKHELLGSTQIINNYKQLITTDYSFTRVSGIFQPPRA